MFLVLAGLLGAVSAPGLEQSFDLGRERRWRDMAAYDGVVSVPGRWGLEDLTLDQGGYRVDADTELLYHFDRTSEGDAAGAWRYAGSGAGAGAMVAGAAAAIGTGGAAFQGRGDGVALAGPKDGLFAPGSAWGDFTIEFWLHPATLANGETVLSWEGGVREGGGVATQALRATFRDRRLVWEARDLFALPGGPRVSFTLTGIRQLLPRAWHHHLLRFDARLGLLEYALDGVVEAVVHATDNGSEKGSVALPTIGAALSGPLVIGGSYTGFLDELRFSRRFVEAPALARFPASSGTAVSRLVDLGTTAARLVRIETVQTTPSDSALFHYYRLSDELARSAGADADAGWIPFAPGTALPVGTRGRWLQLLVEFFPDGRRTSAPTLSTIRVVYEPHLPPLAPAGLVATPGNGKVTLSWRRVDDPEVAGYEVYYGTEPGSWFGDGAAEGPSPIDAGDATGLVVTGLENGRLYYFTVAAYNDAAPKQRSAFAAEAGARPSRIHP